MSDNVLNLSHSVLENAAEKISFLIRKDIKTRPINLYGIPRGGIPALYLVYSELIKKRVSVQITQDPREADAIIDDLVDSGATRDRYLASYPAAKFYSLVSKQDPRYKPYWIIFPWEGSESRSAEDIGVRLLQYIGEDVTREGLLETPKRFAKAWKFYTKGYHQDPKDFMKVFEDGGEGYNSMITMKDIRIFSSCEHHLAPFWGFAYIAYIPRGKIVGISKLARIAEMYSRRLQVQERLTVQIAECLMEALEPEGVAVVLKCRHMCMEARGVQAPGTYTITSALRGSFKENESTRMEFFKLIEDSKLEV